MKTIQFIIALLLFPLSIWYSIGVAVRNLLYNLNILKTKTPEIPTIGIGNLRMGGTGKTPHTEYLIRLFSDRRTALLSRGYGRKTKGFQSTADDTSEHSQSTICRSAGFYPATNHNSESLGDEPAMIARKFPDLTVAVCEDRIKGVEQLMQQSPAPQIVLLDDVYQHRSIKPSLMILLTEYGDPFFNDHILPFGNLREFRSGRRRADIVVVTKCPPSLSQAKRNMYRKKLKLAPHQSLFFSEITYQQPKALYSDAPWQPVREVLLVSGIAHPAPLKHHLEKQCTVKHLAFPDHHNFTTDDCKNIVKTFNSIKDTSKAVVTTEKDSVRLLSPDIRSILGQLPFFYIPISIAFREGDKFDNTIKNFI